MKRIIDEYMSLLPKQPSYPQPPVLTPDIVKGSHQRRMTKECVKETKKALCNANILAGNYTTFEELYTAVRNTILSIRGIGNLAVYDITLRIAHRLSSKPLPNQYVYVARGALEGAQILFGKKVVKKNMNNGVRLPIALFHKLFPNVESEHIEAILCIYKKHFILGGVSKSFTTSNNTHCGNTSSKKKSRTICKNKL